jgi:hypothetical protein
MTFAEPSGKRSHGGSNAIKARLQWSSASGIGSRYSWEQGGGKAEEEKEEFWTENVQVVERFLAKYHVEEKAEL